MKNFMKGSAVYATICTILALALVAGAVANGSNFHGAVPPPDDDGSGNITAQHGAMPPPTDGGGGNILMAHGAVPPPDDGGGGNIVG